MEDMYRWFPLFILFISLRINFEVEGGHILERNDLPPELRLNCDKVKTRQEVYYFRKLMKTKYDLRERNNNVYLEIPFYRMTWVLGWTMRGKRGSLRGRMTQRRGIITEYVIQHLSTNGSWQFINNPNISQKLFVNTGNIAKPATITEAKLKIPVRTLAIRIFPELWEGIPYVMMGINYCQHEEQLRNFSINTGHRQRNDTKFRNIEIPYIKAGRKRPYLGTFDKGHHISSRILMPPKKENKMDFGHLKVSSSGRTMKIHHNSKTYHVKKKNKRKRSKNRKKGMRGKSRKAQKVNKKKKYRKEKRKKLRDRNRGKMKFNPSKLMCVEKSKWRYSNTNSPPSDVFTSRDNPKQAWRAMYGLNIVPYRFMLPQKYEAKRNKQYYLQVSFPEPIEIHGIRISGNVEDNQVGIVRKFSMKFKLGAKHWTEYKDDKNKLRVFDIGNSKQGNTYAASTFKLPYTIRATDIRIYPEKWLDLPFLSLDVKSCDLVEKKRISKENWCTLNSVLGRKGRFNLVNFPLKFAKRKFYRNKKYKEMKFKGGYSKKLTGIRMDIPGPISSAVTRFVLQYRTKAGNWRSIHKKDGKIKLFLTRKKYMKFPQSIHTKAFRIFPQKWTGAHPSLYVDFIGC